MFYAKSFGEVCKIKRRFTNKFRVEAILRKKILAVQGVRRITSFSLDMDRTNRSLSVHFSADTDDGKVDDKVMIDRRNNV